MKLSKLGFARTEPYSTEHNQTNLDQQGNLFDQLYHPQDQLHNYFIVQNKLPELTGLSR
jgi:hypothetical protein